jgi:hypothetical protein
MKSAVIYALGFICGIAVTVGFFSWSQRSAPAATTPPAGATARSTVTTTASSPPASNDSAVLNASASIPPLESALKEIHEAGMVVIPQEFARFLMPSLLSTRPEPAVRQILQLDDREATELAKARMRFDQALQQTIDAHLQVIDVKDGVVTATLPAFKEERQKLIDAWRAESLAALDANSAAIASHIDFNRGIEGRSQGHMELTVTFKPSPDSKKIAIEYQGQTANGAQRQNYRFQTGMPSSQLSRQFPSLRAHFPQLAGEAAP